MKVKELNNYVWFIGILALSATMIVSGIRCSSKSSTNSTNGTNGSNVTLTGLLYQGTVYNVAPTSFNVSNLSAQTATPTTPLSGYLLYCVTFAQPPTASSSGASDSKGNVTLRLPKNTPFGCFINDSSGNSFATLIFNSGTLVTQTVSFSGNADLGEITVDPANGLASVQLPAQGSPVVGISITGSSNTYGVGILPLGIAIDSSGNAWVTNSSSNSVTKFSSKSGAIIGTYPVDGNDPHGIAIDASGNIWVTTNKDNGTCSTVINKLSSSGALLVTSTVEGAAHMPAIDASGNVWVPAIGDFPDYYGCGFSSVVTKFSPMAAKTGAYYFVGHNADSIAIDASDNVLVTTGNNSIIELNSIGATINTYTLSSGISTGAIAIDSSGNIWVANTHLGWNSNGNSVFLGILSSVIELSPAGVPLAAYTVGKDAIDIQIDSSGNVWVVNMSSSTVTELVGVAKGPQYWPYTGPQWPVGF